MIDFSKLARPCDECNRKHRPDRSCADVAALPLISEIVEIDMDLETTGRDVEADRPWQVHAGGRTWVCDPGREFEDGAREVCGIDDEKLREIMASEPWNVIAPDVLDACGRANAIVAYNGLTYDGPLLRASLAAAGLDPSGLPPIIDPRVWAFEMWPDLENHKLKTVYTSGGVGGSMEGIRPHDAGADCLMMRRVWDVIGRERRLWDRTFRAVLAFQERAAKIQAEDWERYGGATPDGAVFLWLRTCRKCLGEGIVLSENDPSDNTATGICLACDGAGVLSHTKKRRGQPLDAGFCGWALRKLDNLPDAVRGKFKEVAG